MTDPISDMLTRIRNAAMASHDTVDLPYSKIKASIAQILAETGFIANFKTEGEGALQKICVELKTIDGGQAISSIERISKPGRRVYAGSGEIPLVLSGRGMVILSTSSGLMTGRDARKKGLGGELICRVW